mmetsp:Transcript_36196/g.78764  ORF Transcript_36196/g.78764 Transcript_36196/m.78764 type:complete len:169 (-) Transcript_36196:2270-2776(-)
MSSPPSSPRPEDIIRLRDLEKRCPGAPRKKRRSRTVFGEESAVQRHYFRPVGDFDLVLTGEGDAAAGRMCHATARSNVIGEPPKAERIKPLRLFPDDGVLSTRSTSSSSNGAAARAGAADSDEQGVSCSIARLTSIAIVDTSTPAGSTTPDAIVANASQDVRNKLHVR